jgi:Trypsin-co-occurring domain 2
MMGANAGRWVGSMGSLIGGVVAVQVELAQVIGQLRRELSAVMRVSEGEDLRFELGQVESELTVAVSKEAGPNAKVRFCVIELGADGKVASQATQRITLTLDRRRRGVAGKPLISGSEQAGER